MLFQLSLCEPRWGEGDESSCHSSPQASSTKVTSSAGVPTRRLAWKVLVVIAETSIM